MRIRAEGYAQKHNHAQRIVDDPVMLFIINIMWYLVKSN